VSIKSEAQKKRLQKLAEEGKLNPDTLDRMLEDVSYMPLPERAAWPRVSSAQKVKSLRPIKSLGPGKGKK
jgi:hypothetical protein